MNAGLHSESSGQGPALVLWHGWGMNLRCFDALAGALEGTHQLVAVDLPGHGRSPWRADWNSGDWLPSLLATVPQGATLVGWSLGGQFALRAAAAHASPVARLVLFCTTPRFVAAADWPHGIDGELARQFHRRLASDPARVLADFLELELRGDAEAEAHRATLQAALAAHGSARTEALAAGLALLENTDLRELLPTIRQPVLIFSGQHDRVTRAAAGAALAGALPHAEHVLLPRTGHAPMLSADERWLAPLRRFLAAS